MLLVIKRGDKLRLNLLRANVTDLTFVLGNRRHWCPGIYNRMFRNEDHMHKTVKWWYTVCDKAKPRKRKKQVWMRSEYKYILGSGYYCDVFFDVTSFVRRCYIREFYL